jgi:hypothetical protein
VVEQQRAHRLPAHDGDREERDPERADREPLPEHEERATGAAQHDPPRDAALPQGHGEPLDAAPTGAPEQAHDREDDETRPEGDERREKPVAETLPQFAVEAALRGDDDAGSERGGEGDGEPTGRRRR